MVNATFANTPARPPTALHDLHGLTIFVKTANREDDYPVESRISAIFSMVGS